MRLNKYIAQAGICSRRKADELTKEGKVKINGAVMKEPGYDVQDGDVVMVGGVTLEAPEQHVYYALNKPCGYITTTSDEKDRPTVISLLTDVTARVYPVGRLDGDTSGLLLLTNDGDLTYHVSHPSKKVYKTYLALVAGYLKKDELWALRNGVDIGEKRPTAPARVTILKEKSDTTLLEIQICEGRNRQVRRMCKAVGHTVLELQRTAIGEIKLGRLLEGNYRKLTPREIEYLKNC
ncbi:MAG: rRNA pseudouridine synthase [Clostridia bacterium]|nr:rRNA pseudouridine synthase [Clostridia bacterium]